MASHEQGPQVRRSIAETAAFRDRTTQVGFHPARSDRVLTAKPIGFHVTLRLEDDRPLATTPAALRVIARVVLAQGESRGLLAFGTADNHLHAELATDRAAAGAFALYVETTLRWQLRLGASFERARIRPLGDQKHAYNTFHYVHRQDARHGLGLDDAREGTSLPDLLGLRVLETSLGARVRTHLPRIRREDLVGHYPAALFEPSTLVDLDHLADAAAAALALPDLRGRTPDMTRARRAAVHAAGRDVRAQHVADALGIGVRAVQTFRAPPSDPLLVRAVEKQLLLRTLLTNASRAG